MNTLQPAQAPIHALDPRHGAQPQPEEAHSPPATAAEGDEAPSPGEALFDAAEYAALPEDARALVNDAARGGEADDSVLIDLHALLRDPSFQILDPTRQGATLADVALQQSPEFEALSAGDQRLVAEALAGREPGDTGLAAAIRSLISSPQFQSGTDFSAAERTAILSQVRNYPDTRVVENLEAIVGKQWFRDFDLGDSQRAAKTVAFLSQHDAGDQEIIANTLALFLAPDAPYRFDFSQTGGAFGSVPPAPQDLFKINPQFIHANNNPVELTPYSEVRGELRVIGHTFVHEVNHMQNWDRSLSLRSSYGFHEEYRAFWVGVKAQHGREPTVADVLDRLQIFVTPGGGYAHLSALLQAGGQDALEIADYVNTILGRDDITFQNARQEVDALVQLKKAHEDQGLPLPESLARPAGMTIGPPGTNNVTNE